jgi:hypothetical protein
VDESGESIDRKRLAQAKGSAAAQFDRDAGGRSDSIQHERQKG